MAKATPQKNTSSDLRMTVYASLMAALTAAGAFMAVPIGPVPIVLQNFFVLLTGLLLGPRWGCAAMGVYLLAGIVGLPVFAGGHGGIGRLAGPTGGYLMSYLPTVFVVGWISEKKWGGFWGDLLALLLGTAIIYGLGFPWLKLVTGLSWKEAFAAGVIPFWIGDAIKIAAAFPVAKLLRPIVR
jgi:biotin transport system substrate-specific component